MTNEEIVERGWRVSFNGVHGDRDLDLLTTPMIATKRHATEAPPEDPALLAPARLLEILACGESYTQAELMALTELGQQTISSALSRLVAKRLVVYDDIVRTTKALYGRKTIRRYKLAGERLEGGL